MEPIVLASGRLITLEPTWYPKVPFYNWVPRKPDRSKSPQGQHHHAMLTVSSRPKIHFHQEIPSGFGLFCFVLSFMLSNISKWRGKQEGVTFDI